MSFGLSVAPGYFEIFMEHCFSTIPQKQLSHYLDDCIVPADSVDDMLTRIENFLYLIVKFRMKLSPSKCLFFQRQISFLGFILNEKGMKKSPEYVKRILDAPRPRTVHELMKFLGLVNFQRKFVPYCSEIIAPLNEAVEHKAKNIKKKEIVWTKEMEDAFELIKKELAKDVALAFPQTSPDAAELKLFVDASKIAIGSSLFQEQDGEMRPISYVSKLLSKTELRYSSYDKEILAFVKGIVAHQQYLLGRKFTVYTDCKNIVYLYKMKNCCSRLLRLLEQLSSYDFTIEHVAGIDNYVSDMMSRLSHFTDPEFYKKLTDHVLEDYVPEDLMEVQVGGGPESPFTTISLLLKQMKNEAIDTAKLRELLISEILDNPVKYGVQGRPDDLQSLRAMLKPGVATYVIVFQSAAEFFKVNFYIYFGIEQPLVFRPLTNKNDSYPNLYVMCRGQGVHFNPLFEKNSNFESDQAFNAMGVEVERDSVLKVANILDEKEEQECKIQSLAVYQALFSDVEDNKPAANCCLSCHSTPMSRPIERSLLTLYLRKYRDPYLCPNKHTLGDFCLKLQRPRRPSAFEGAEKVDDTRNNLAQPVYLCLAVDTGSSISLITESTHKKLCAAGFAEVACNLETLPPEESEIQVLNGTVYAVGYARITFPFWFVGSGARARHDFLVLPDEALSACMLLGGDFLKNLDIKIACRDDKVNWHRPSIAKIKSARNFEFLLNSVDSEINEKQNQLIKETVACARKVKRRVEKSSQKRFDPTIQLEEGGYPFSIQEVEHLQYYDWDTRQLKKSVERNQTTLCPKSLRPIFQKFSIVQSSSNKTLLLYSHDNSKPVPVISKKFLITIATQLHDTYTHIGRAKLLLLLRKFCWSPCMAINVAEVTRSCPFCQVNKPDTGKLAPPVHRREVLNPYDLVCIDILSLPNPCKGNTHMLIVAEHASKWLQLYSIKGHTSETIIKNLKQYIMTSVKCPNILSDNEASLCLDQFKQFCTDYNIHHIYSSPYNPSCNGFSEKNCGMVTV